ncbi:MAG: Txe/YoeB family addiction module toxin [Christensenella sp.]
MYKIVYAKKSLKDIPKLQAAKLAERAKLIIDVVRGDPFQSPPSYEKLGGDLKGYYSRRINAKHRFVYQVYEEEKTVKILSMWTHYEL